MNPIRSVFLSNLRYDSLLYFPFQVSGILALLILAVMAGTSHDFWLKNLGPKVWKGLHMFVYAAYALIILHVLLGGLQNETSMYIYGLLFGGVIWISLIHLVAAYKERRKDLLNNAALETWIRAGLVSEIEEDHSKIVVINKKRVAIFKYDGKISAVSNYCRHQGGPLGEGRIIDGCITCPWHGYQYFPENGQSPPPYSEKIETYNVRLINGLIEVYSTPNEPGTRTAPAMIT